MSASETSFGVYKPVGHVVISFPTAKQADEAGTAITPMLELGSSDIRSMTDRDMLAQTEADIHNASPLANLGQELNLAKSHRELAQLGYHWLIVRAEGELAQQVADCAKAHGAERAQRYGRLMIEELIEHSTDLPQVAESPDRGLDPQTPSGTEAERAELRPPEDERASSDTKR